VDGNYGIEFGAFGIEVLRGYTECSRIDIQEPRVAARRLDGFEYDGATIEWYSDT
jgi:hypothetical protein